MKLYHDEVAREFEVDSRLTFRYAITNYGRLISFSDDIMTGRMLKGGRVEGYNVLNYRIRENGKVLNKHIYLRKIVAQLFVPNDDITKEHVIQLDYNKSNDYYKNLKWATRQEMLDHQKKNPCVIEGRKKVVEHNIKSDGRKLRVNEVIFIKKRLADPNRTIRMKMLAKQFNISEMQLYRIKRGENWGHIKV
ncbi:MAG TPA: hypothetical protein PLU17_12505 [Chitinophagaceae bacterium]|jgi:hypothetical protein|nr:hypothetical protein [Chitinophagaceae bacterium]